MALKSKRPRPWLSRLHFLARLVGLTALGAAVLAVALAWRVPELVAEARGLLQRRAPVPQAVAG